MSDNIIHVRLQRPVDGDWAFVLLPRNVSDTQPSRGITAVQGTLNGVHFHAMLEPDGQKSHWLRVEHALREAAGAAIGDMVSLTITPCEDEPEPEMPADLEHALASDTKAQAVWKTITRKARRDWIHWIVSPKRAETRARRIENACSMLAAGKKRVCCFDRSGFYSKSLSAPQAASD